MSLSRRRAAAGRLSPMRRTGNPFCSSTSTRLNGARLSATVAPAGPAPRTTASTSHTAPSVPQAAGEAPHLFDRPQVHPPCRGAMLRRGGCRHYVGDRLVLVLDLEGGRGRAVGWSLARLGDGAVIEMRDHVVDLVGVAFAAERIDPGGPSGEGGPPLGQ